MSETLPSRVGFIGLGVMGYPMVQNLIKKLSSSTRISVYDIFEDACTRIKAEGGDKIAVCASAKEVTENSVGS